MHFSDVLRISFLNTMRAKTRSMLTAVSIMIGVASVLLVSTIGESGGTVIVNEIEKFGLDGISVYQSSGNSEPIYDSDADVLKNKFSSIEAVMPFVMQYGTYKINKTGANAVIMGVGANADKIYNITVLYGRIPNEADIKRGRQVAVIDAELAEKCYHRQNIVGKKVVLNLQGNSQEYNIVGIISPQKDGINQLLGGNLPDFIYVPYSALNSQRGSRELSQIAIKCSTQTDGREFANYLSRIKGAGKEGYVAQNLSSRVGEVKSLTGVISTLMSAIAAIALCVAGIGIMNTMFSSAKERAREIGICMAIGARAKDILMCFMAESIIISVIGGTIGAAAGFGIIEALSKLLKFRMIYDYKTFITAEIVSVICGGLFSLIPAAKAAAMEPIEALKRDNT